MKVKIEALRTSKLISRCKKCQRFEHTQKLCGDNPRYVKCASNHLIFICNKAQNAKPQCAAKHTQQATVVV